MSRPQLSVSTAIDYALLRTTPFAAPLLCEVMVTHTPEKAAWPVLRRVYTRGSELYDQIFARFP
jgi:hypothetical protein